MGSVPQGSRFKFRVIVQSDDSTESEPHCSKLPDDLGIRLCGHCASQSADHFFSFCALFFFYSRCIPPRDTYPISIGLQLSRLLDQPLRKDPMESVVERTRRFLKPGFTFL